MRDVDVFLFDEPLSNLDAKLRADLRVELKRLHEQLKNTMIYVTHDQVEAMTLADRIAIMKGGQIMQLDSPANIYNKPRNRYVAGFIGSPAMNFIEGALEGSTFNADGFSAPLDGYSWVGDAPSAGPVTLGLRPEHILTEGQVNEGTLTTEVIADLVEPMGADTLVWSNLAGQPFRFRMDGQAQVKAGDSVPIGIDMTRASVFDVKTELRL